MANCAKVALTGRLTREPTQKTWNNTTVVSFNLAVNTTKKEGDKYLSDFYNISVWGKPAEFILPRIRKGLMVQVYGDLYTEMYTGKDGVEKQSLTVRATDIFPLESVKGKQNPVQTERPEEENPF